VNNIFYQFYSKFKTKKDIFEGFKIYTMIKLFTAKKISKTKNLGRNERLKRDLDLDLDLDLVKGTIYIIYDYIIDSLKELNLEFDQHTPKCKEDVEEFIKFLYTSRYVDVIKGYYKKFVEPALLKTKSGRLYVQYVRKINEFINYAYLTKKKHLIENALKQYSRYSIQIEKSDYEVTMSIIAKALDIIERHVLGWSVNIKYIIVKLAKEIFQSSNILSIPDEDRKKLQKILVNVKKVVNAYKIGGLERAIDELVRMELEKKYKLRLSLADLDDREKLKAKILEYLKKKNSAKSMSIISKGRNWAGLKNQIESELESILNTIDALKEYYSTRINEETLHADLINLFGGSIIFNAVNSKLSLHTLLYQHSPKGDSREITFEDIISDEKSEQEYVNIERNKDLEVFIRELRAEVERNKDKLKKEDIKVIDMLIESLISGESGQGLDSTLEMIYQHLSTNPNLKEIVLNTIRKTNFLDI